MELNTRAQAAQNQHNNSPIVLVHDLFSSLDSLGVLTRDLINDHNTIQVGIRNHGLSPRDPVMNYLTMVQDLVDTLDAQRINEATLIDHSMGGKAVITLTALAPDRIDRLVAIDVALVDYHVHRHDEIFAAVGAVSESGVQTRQQAAAIMRQHLNEEGVIQFLLKSSVNGGWRFNVPVLWDQYPHIVGREKILVWDHPTLFIPGGNSPYVSEQYHDDLLAQLPQVQTHVIAGASHWIHVEEPDAILCVVRRYPNDQCN